jgi:hypothetical protein
MLAEVIEQRREGREFAADGGIGQLAGLEMLSPSDDVNACFTTRNSVGCRKPANAENSPTSIL